MLIQAENNQYRSPWEDGGLSGFFKIRFIGKEFGLDKWNNIVIECRNKVFVFDVCSRHPIGDTLFAFIKIRDHKKNRQGEKTAKVSQGSQGGFHEGGILIDTINSKT